MVPLSRSESFLNADVAKLITHHFTPQETGKLRQVSLAWRNTFSVDLIWTDFLKKDYPESFRVGMTQTRDLYYKIKQVAYNCKKYEFLVHNFSIFVPNLIWKPFLEMSHENWAYSPSYAVSTYSGVNLYCLNPDRQVFVLNTTPGLAHPQIFQDKYLTISNYKSVNHFEIWDLDKKEKIFDSLGTPCEITGKRDFIYFTREQTLQLLPTLANKLTGPLTIEHRKDSRFNAPFSELRTLQQGRDLYIASLNGDLLKKISLQNSIDINDNQEISLFQTQNFYILDPVDSSYFLIFFKKLDKEIKLAKSALASVRLYGENLIYQIDREIRMIHLNSLNPGKEIGIQILHTFEDKSIQLLGCFGNKIVLGNSPTLNYGNFLIIDINTKLIAKIPNLADYTLEPKNLYKNGLIIFTGKKNAFDGFLIIIDAFTGKEIKQSTFYGNFAGMTDNNVLVFVNLSTKPFIKFSTIDLNKPDREKIDDIEYCFEFI